MQKSKGGSDLFSRIWKYIKGYVIIIIEGFFIEKFINLASNAELKFWDLKRLSLSKIQVKAGIKDFKRIRPIVRKSKCRAELKKKVGIPFFLNRYNKRGYFVIGFVLFLLICFICSLFVWKVEVSGNDKIQAEEVIEQLKECGLHTGKIKYFVNADDVVEQMMIKREDLAWIGIEIEGTKAEVKIVEKVMIPEMLEKTPCNIVSDRVGIITKMNVMIGAKQVEIGDTVQKGQVLVSGVIEGKYPEDTRKVHALAEIEMRVWYEGKASVKLEQETGIISEDEAKSIAYNEAYNSIVNNLPNDINISNKVVNYIVNEGVVTAEMVLECVEKVGVEEDIMPSP